MRGDIAQVFTENAKRPWIETSTGNQIDLWSPKPSDVTLPDIAHALARICRFTGHTKTHYSVAQHSVMVARMLRDEGHATGTQLAGLLHDAHEAYTGDVASPIKKRLGETWADFEAAHEIAVRTRFGLPIILPPSVKIADLRMLATERRDFMPPGPPWDVLIGVEPYSLRLGGWYPDVAEASFLDEAARLGAV